MNSQTPIRDLQLCWWSYAERGGLAIVFAAVLFFASSFLGIFFFDRVTLIYLSLLLGSFVLGNGLILAVAAVFTFEHRMHIWWLVMCESGFTILLGIYIGMSFLLTPQSLAFLAGIHGVGNGCFQTALAIKLRADRLNLFLLAIAGIISLLVGIAFLTHYHQAPRITTQALAGYELFCGIIWMVFAYRLHK